GDAVEQADLVAQRQDRVGIGAKLQRDRRILGTILMKGLPDLAETARAEQSFQDEIRAGYGMVAGTETRYSVGDEASEISRLAQRKAGGNRASTRVLLRAQRAADGAGHLFEVERQCQLDVRRLVAGGFAYRFFDLCSRVGVFSELLHVGPRLFLAAAATFVGFP